MRERCPTGEDHRHADGVRPTGPGLIDILSGEANERPRITLTGALCVLVVLQPSPPRQCCARAGAAID
jgi:hypothetical protein